MSDLLELVYEYRSLLAKEAQEDALEAAASQRLQALSRLFGSEPSQADAEGSVRRRRHARCDLEVSATLKIGEDVHPVAVINVGGGGLCVSPAPELSSGKNATISIVSDDCCKIYQYEVRAGWVQRSRGRSSMGMPFVGAPRAMPLPLPQ